MMSLFSNRCFFILFVLSVCCSQPLYAGLPVSVDVMNLVQANVGIAPLAVRRPSTDANRLFIVLQSGRIVIYDTNTSTLLNTPFLDIGSRVVFNGEQGLLGLAFHPNYASNGFFYVNYIRDDPNSPLNRTVISRFSVSAADPNQADAGSEQVLLEIVQDFENHNGGDMHFGPDNYLYIGIGDGGSGGDPNNRAQTLTTLLGKILRIDVDGTPQAGEEICGLQANNSSANGYGIPAGNPFAGAATGCDEIWAYGLRHPFRWSFDRSTGAMLIGDVGQNLVEEISFQPAGVGGLNYGWRCREGNQDFNNNPSCPGTLQEPIMVYPHESDPCSGSVIGGFRYRGAYQPLQGTYFFADYCKSRLYFATQDNFGNWPAVPDRIDIGLRITGFGEDADGEIYFVATDSNLYRIDTPAGPSGRIFEDDFETAISGLRRDPVADR
jgi:glucose/arabinose dehydrogenase